MSRAAPPASQAVPSSALTRQRTPAQLRLETLQKEHDRLLRDIARKRASRDLTEQAARDAASALEGRAAPMRAALAATLTELRGIFAALLGEESRLNRRDKGRVRRLYFQILPELAADFQDRSAGGEDRARDASDWEQGPSPHASRETRADPDAGYSAQKPSHRDPGLLRTLFRRLAVALHPDKVRDATLSAELTAVMKQVTCAYESGDLARLVELERTWLADGSTTECEDVAPLAGRIEQLLQANKDLRRQLRALNAELKELKQSIVCHGVRPRNAGPVDFSAAVDEIVEEMRCELARLEGLRDFAASFLRADITLEEFLLGPPMNEASDSLDQLFADMLFTLMGDEENAPSRRRRRRRG